MRDDIKIVPYRNCHIKQAYEAEQICFSNPWTLGDVEDVMCNEATVFFTAVDCSYTDEDKVAGYVGMYRVLDEGQILNIAVLPQYRKMGVGSALLEKIIEFSRGNGITFLTLEVRESNTAARALYEKFGFYQVGIRRDYYTAPKENAILMNMDIK